MIVQVSLRHTPIRWDFILRGTNKELIFVSFSLELNYNEMLAKNTSKDPISLILLRAFCQWNGIR